MIWIRYEIMNLYSFRQIHLQALQLVWMIDRFISIIKIHLKYDHFKADKNVMYTKSAYPSDCFKKNSVYSSLSLFSLGRLKTYKNERPRTLLCHELKTIVMMYSSIHIYFTCIVYMLVLMITSRQKSIILPYLIWMKIRF